MEAMTGLAESAESYFRTAVKTKREALGLTQRGLADLLRDDGVTMDPSAVARLESGHRAIRLGEAVAIANILGFQIHSDTADSSVVVAARRIRKMARQLDTLANALAPE